MQVRRNIDAMVTQIRTEIARRSAAKRQTNATSRSMNGTDASMTAIG